MIWVIVVLFIFLWNLRTSLITLAAIPATWPIGSIAMAFKLPMVSPVWKKTLACQAMNRPKTTDCGSGDTEIAVMLSDRMT